MAGVTEEVAKAAGGFMSVMSQQPLALALVIMNFVLLGFLFYNGSSTNAARKDTVDTVIKWQQDTDKLLAGCVSAETNRTMLDHMQRITETMLTAEQKEIARMQDAINKEREKSYQLREREADELEQLKKQQRQAPEPMPKSQPNNYRPGTQKLLMKLALPPFNKTPAVEIHQKKQEQEQQR